MKDTHQILLDRIPRVAIDKTARVVTSTGVHFHQDYCKGVYDNVPSFGQAPYNVRDLVGQQNGKMVIVGYKDSYPKKGGRRHRWWARCLCGVYEVREHRQWISDYNKGFVDKGCGNCRKMEKILNGGDRCCYWNIDGEGYVTTDCGQIFIQTDIDRKMMKCRYCKGIIRRATSKEVDNAEGR